MSNIVGKNIKRRESKGTVILFGKSDGNYRGKL